MHAFCCVWWCSHATFPRNIPNRYTRDMLIDRLDKGYKVRFVLSEKFLQRSSEFFHVLHDPGTDRISTTSSTYPSTSAASATLVMPSSTSEILLRLTGPSLASWLHAAIVSACQISRRIPPDKDEVRRSECGMIPNSISSLRTFPAFSYGFRSFDDPTAAVSGCSNNKTVAPFGSLDNKD